MQERHTVQVQKSFAVDFVHAQVRPEVVDLFLENDRNSADRNLLPMLRVTSSTVRNSERNGYLFEIFSDRVHIPLFNLDHTGRISFLEPAVRHYQSKKCPLYAAISLFVPEEKFPGTYS